jgi:uncharacterized membrane protein YccF (DUF307 family)
MNREQKAKTPNPSKLQRVLRVVLGGFFGCLSWCFFSLVLVRFSGLFWGFFCSYFSLFNRLFS